MCLLCINCIFSVVYSKYNRLTECDTPKCCIVSVLCRLVHHRDSLSRLVLSVSLRKLSFGLLIFLAWSHSSCFSLEHELSFFPTSGEHPSYTVPSHDAGLLCAQYVAWWSFLRKCRWFFNPDAIFGFMCHWKCSLRWTNRVSSFWPIWTLIRPKAALRWARNVLKDSVVSCYWRITGFIQIFQLCNKTECNYHVLSSLGGQGWDSISKEHTLLVCIPGQIPSVVFQNKVRLSTIIEMSAMASVTSWKPGWCLCPQSFYHQRLTCIISIFFIHLFLDFHSLYSWAYIPCMVFSKSRGLKIWLSGQCTLLIQSLWWMDCEPFPSICFFPPYTICLSICF